MQDNDLTARWLQPGPDEGTRRDTVLRELREGGRSTETDLRGIDLTHESLEGVDLSRCDLSGAHLAKANLSGANLAMCKLVDADLFGADLTGCELLSADLSGANLGECLAARAGFGGATLDGAQLLAAQLADATFAKASLRRADLRAAKAAGARFGGADLTRANLARTDLRDCDLESCVVDGADFGDSDLRNARLKGLQRFDTATWILADIHLADFCGAYLVRRHIMDANFIHEFRSRNKGTEILYRIWWLTSDCGRSVSRWALWTFLVAAVFAGVYALIGVDFGDNETFLSPLYFSIVTLTSLGYGDIVPKTAVGQILIMIEVVAGYVALGGLLSIFAMKMARRAE